MRNIKIAAALAICGLVLWLALEPSIPEQRLARLQRLCRSGQMAALSATNLSEFQALVEKVTKAAGINSIPVIQSAPQRGRLHFYVSDPTLQWFTRCGRGNAVYDSDLDAVFVDRSLWQPMELTKIGQAPPFVFEGARFAFSRTFVEFVLLHELGHRQLHRSRAATYDAFVRGASTLQESEADMFAVNAMKSGYLSGTLGDTDISDELIEAGFAPDLQPDQRAAAALLYAATQMNVGLLFSRGAFSSLYSDATHPGFGERVQQMVRALEAGGEHDKQFQAHLEYFRQLSIRMEEVRQHHFIEVHTDTPIEDVAFDEDGISIVDTGWNLWHVSATRLQKRLPVEPPELQPLGKLPLVSAGAFVTSMWSAPANGLFVAFSDSEVFQLHGGKIMARSDLAAALHGGSYPVLLPNVEPTEIAVHNVASNLLVTNLDRVVASIPIEDLMSKLPDTGKQYQNFVLDSIVTGNTLHIPIHEEKGPMIGCLELDLQDPSTARFTEFDLKGDIDAYGGLVAMQDGARWRHFMVGKLSSKVAVWEVFQAESPLLRGTHDTFASQLAKAASPILQRSVEPYLSKVRFIPPATILVTLLADSVYQFDARSNQLSVAFHPGTSMNISLGPKGRFALSALNGYKLYIGSQ